jgi:Mn2+/Fe2+ NRAMP family transporter
LLCVIAQIFSTYANYSKYLKWLTLALFSYVATVFMVHVPWGDALKHTIWPSFQRNGGYWATFIAVLGTTISPYLFFWQASLETEDIKAAPNEQSLLADPKEARHQFGRIRFDTYVGMAFSNIVAFFIILAAAVTLNAHNITDIQTSSQAAEALRPIAGRFTFVIFTLGIVGTGLLAVPALAGSAAYAVGEACKWPCGMARKPLAAKGFYGVLAAATALGLALNLPAVQHHTHLSPIKALFWSAVLNGLVSTPVMVVMMLMFESKKVMGQFSRVSRRLKWTGWLATAVMLCAAVWMFVTWKH